MNKKAEIKNVKNSSVSVDQKTVNINLGGYLLTLFIVVYLANLKYDFVSIFIKNSIEDSYLKSINTDIVTALQGHVTLGNSDEVMTGVRIKIEGKEHKPTTTDSNGFYDIKGLTGKNNEQIIVTAEYDGYFQRPNDIKKIDIDAGIKNLKLFELKNGSE